MWFDDVVSSRSRHFQRGKNQIKPRHCQEAVPHLHVHACPCPMMPMCTTTGHPLGQHCSPAALCYLRFLSTIVAICRPALPLPLLKHHTSHTTHAIFHAPFPTSTSTHPQQYIPSSPLSPPPLLFRQLSCVLRLYICDFDSTGMICEAALLSASAHQSPRSRPAVVGAGLRHWRPGLCGPSGNG